MLALLSLNLNSASWLPFGQDSVRAAVLGLLPLMLVVMPMCFLQPRNGVEGEIGCVGREHEQDDDDQNQPILALFFAALLCVSRCDLR